MPLTLTSDLKFLLYCSQLDTVVYRCMVPLEKVVRESLTRYLPQARYRRVEGQRYIPPPSPAKPTTTSVKQEQDTKSTGKQQSPAKNSSRHSTPTKSNDVMIENGVSLPVVSISRLEEKSSLVDHDYL